MTTPKYNYSRHISPDLLYEDVPTIEGLYRPLGTSKDPLGLTILYEPVTTPTADIIFVHGADGVSIQTWSKNRDPAFFWLTHWLPCEWGLETTRILAFGYRLKDIEDISKELLSSISLKAKRDYEGGGMRKVPIILVAHSVGGLIIQRAFFEGRKRSVYQDVIYSIKAVVFLGTPHRGLDAGEHIRFMSLIPSGGAAATRFLDSILGQSHVLEAFHHAASDMDIFSFYETLSTTFQGGESRLIVDKNSAILGLDKEIAAPLHADHRNICRYASAEDPNYIRVRNVLHRLVSKLHQRAIQEKKMEGVTETLSVLGTTIDGGDLIFLKSLQVPGTCSWILRNDIFNSWVQNPSESEVLWIHASPGRGKTVLAAFIINELLKARRNICCYFFFKVGDQPKRSSAACLKSLALQAARQIPDFHRILTGMSIAGVKLGNADTKTIWKRLFMNKLFEIRIKETLYLVIDGVDSQQDLLEALSGFPSFQMRVKILLVSRNDSDALLRFQSPFLSLSVGNRDGDIRLLAEQKLETFPIDSLRKTDIINRLIAIANGDFARANSVLDQINISHTYEQIGEVLEQVPDVIDNLATDEDIYETDSAQGSSVAYEVVGVLLAHKNDLRPFFEEALTKMEKERFVRNLRRLLKKYYIDLKQNVNNNLQQATIDLLRTRCARDRIAEQIANILEPESEEVEAEMEQRLLTIEKGLVDLESSTNNTPGLASSDDETDDSTIMSDSSSDDEDNENSNIQDLPNISEMEGFLLEGPAFRRLVVSMCLLLLPSSLSSLTRIIMSIPSKHIWFESEEDTSMLNRSKIFIEDQSTGSWDWWPLQPPMRFLQKDQVRIHWKCHCGTYLWRELSTSQSQIYKTMVAYRENALQHHHLCRGRRSTSYKVSIANWCIKTVLGAVQPAQNWHGSPGRSSSPRSQGAQPTPKRSNQSTNFPRQYQNNALDSQTGFQTGIGASVLKHLFILFGVKGNRRTLELAQIDVKQLHDDADFFMILRNNYRELRGFWKYWFSVWTLRHCDFVKFEKIRPNRIIFREKSLPTDLNYEYKPRPPDAEIPPISAHEFELAFKTCGPKCALSFLHDCVEAPCGDFAIQRIPKRVGALEVKIGSVELAWGIQAQHAISSFRILLYHVLILVATFGPWAWWLKLHPGDLQNAAVPFSTAAVLISLFWSSAGVLKIFEPPT
ncbi:hypothetical protein F5884DRAFT_850522 [Xylogone sp. PMI_703]|nr:hypothetical protein F5884DRAFT_850522 [Xylogone sp. PMI_703]